MASPFCEWELPGGRISEKSDMLDQSQTDHISEVLYESKQAMSDEKNVNIMIWLD